MNERDFNERDFNTPNVLVFFNSSFFHHLIIISHHLLSVYFSFCLPPLLPIDEISVWLHEPSKKHEERFLSIDMDPIENIHAMIELLKMVIFKRILYAPPVASSVFRGGGYFGYVLSLSGRTKRRKWPLKRIIEFIIFSYASVRRLSASQAINCTFFPKKLCKKVQMLSWGRFLLKFAWCSPVRYVPVRHDFFWEGESFMHTYFCTD